MVKHHGFCKDFSDGIELLVRVDPAANYWNMSLYSFFGMSVMYLLGFDGLRGTM